jgi:hypothetical protein
LLDVSCYYYYYFIFVELRFAEANERKLQKQIDNGIDLRFKSQTAPAYSNKDHPQYRAAKGNNSRAPNTKALGTVTRRTENPVRRGNNNNSETDSNRKVPATAPAIAVSGMGGLRIIKAGNGGQNYAKKPGLPR